MTVRNVTTTIQDNHLYIDVDLSQDYGASASNKSRVIATTGGGTSIDGAPDNIRLNLTVYAIKKFK